MNFDCMEGKAHHQKKGREAGTKRKEKRRISKAEKLGETGKKSNFYICLQKI